MSKQCELVKPDGGFNSGVGLTYVRCTNKGRRYRHPQGHYFWMCDECHRRVWEELKPHERAKP